MRTFGSLFSEIQWQLILFNRKTYGLLKCKKSERRLNTLLNPGAQIVCQKSVPQLNFHYAGFISRKVPRKNGNEFSGLILILLPTSLAIQEEKGNLSRSRYRQVWFLLRLLSLVCQWPPSCCFITWQSLYVSMSLLSLSFLRRTPLILHWAFHGVAQSRTRLNWLSSSSSNSGKESPVQAMQEMQIQALDREDPLEKEMATHSSILAWESPWTESGGLQYMGSQRVEYHWATEREILD